MDRCLDFSMQPVIMNALVASAAVTDYSTVISMQNVCSITSIANVSFIFAVSVPMTPFSFQPRSA